MTRDATQSLPTADASRARTVIVASLLFCAAFALHAWNAARFEAAGAFEQYDLLFDTDPCVRRNWFAHGWWQGDLTHVLAGPIVHYPVKVLGKLGEWAGLVTPGTKTFREDAALLAVPLLTALRAVLALGLFRTLGATLRRAVLLSAFDQVAMATLVFACQPDHFAMTSCAAMAALLVWARAARRGERPGLLAMALLATVLTGITVTNVVPVVAGTFLVGCFASGAAGESRTARMWMSARRAAAVGGIAAALVLASWAVQSRPVASATPDPPPAAGRSFVSKYLRADPGAEAADFPRLLQLSVIGDKPGIGPNPLATAKGSRHPFAFTYSGSHGAAAHALGVLALGAIVVGALSLRKHVAGGAAVAAAAGAWIASQWALHAFWGSTETFLYAPHWIAAETLLIAAIFLRRDDARPAITDLRIAVIVAATLAWNLQILDGMLNRLA